MPKQAQICQAAMPTLAGQLQLAISQTHELLSVLAHVRDTGLDKDEMTKIRQRLEVSGTSTDLGFHLAALIKMMKENEHGKTNAAA